MAGTAAASEREQAGLYCSTSGTYFTDKDSLAAHYKSDFHRYYYCVPPCGNCDLQLGIYASFNFAAIYAYCELASHRYNLKRKIAGLPPVTREWFDARKEQLTATARTTASKVNGKRVQQLASAA